MATNPRGGQVPSTPPQPVRRYTEADIATLRAAGRLPLIQIGSGRFATSRPVQVGDIFQVGGSTTKPIRPNSIRLEGQDKDIFYPIPQNVSNPGSYGKNGNTAPGADDILQGRSAQAKFGQALGMLSASENSLQLSNLTGKSDVKPTYVVGTQARISALKSARSSLLSLTLQGGAQRAASTTLQKNIEQNLKLAQNQRNEVQSVLSQFRAKQRAAQRVNAEVQSGRRPRKSAGAVIPNLPGLLGPTRKY